MKKTVGILFIFMILTHSLSAGVVKKEKFVVNFGNFGTFTSLQSSRIDGMKKATDSESEFKGKSLLGKLAGKLALRSGSFGEIIDLPGKTIYSLDRIKQTYTSNPIQKYQAEERGEQTPQQEQAEEAGESNIKIVKSEFKVNETGESKVINEFQCTQYTVSWITEWENTQTGEKGTTKLLTTVWTTPLSDDINLCRQEEANFAREYMKQIGLTTDELQQQILGTQWQTLFAQMDTSRQDPRQEASQFADEMDKIKGYPVVIDGKYFSTRQGGEQAQAEEETQRGARKMLGRLAKKVLQKKKREPTSEEPSFSYYVELMEIIPGNVEPSVFQVPSGYKKK